MLGEGKSISWPAWPVWSGRYRAYGVCGRKRRWGWDRQALVDHVKVSAYYLRAVGSHGRILSRGGLHFRKVSLVAVGVEDGLEG